MAEHYECEIEFFDWACFWFWKQQQKYASYLQLSWTEQTTTFLNQFLPGLTWFSNTLTALQASIIIDKRFMDLK